MQAMSAQCIQLPFPALTVALAGKGKVRLTVGKRREGKRNNYLAAGKGRAKVNDR